MKIAFLTPEYPHATTGKSGGIGTSIRNLSKGLLAQQQKVLVLVYGQPKDAVFYDEGIEIHQIKNIKLKGLSWWLIRKKIETKINSLYQKKQLEIVEAPDWTGITSFIQTKKCPIVIRLHGTDTYFCHLEQRPVKWINKFHEKRALKKANGLISVSAYTAKVTNQIFDLDKKFAIIPNGIDTDLFKKEIENEPLEQTILYFGSLIRKKGLLELPYIFNEVVKQHQHVKLVLVGADVRDIKTGNSSTWELMQPLFDVEALNNVTYLGVVPYADMKQHITEASVCVFPSFAEALPVSWIEAMAMEKAIVASNIGWAKEVIDNEINGFIEHPINHKAYAQKIWELLQDEELRAKFGEAARFKVEQYFSQEVVAKQSLEFYKGMI
ncbi:Glycosyltransferase involved in cell wall bisynthesis [Lutibacter agarilyticus]|uniref:Glycosyltransferase involved in cell wall bisynthesis n=1 Tax=Lutibacter agarilyticus TaxID=1109740 RepID=A0A238YYS8_9FLAO|nr:glycosyltransferase family 4 protein [Lutibacter agarilyticus]SNR75834.1 Glycosyltransferase involved in cell wall bisynthesis [Lutibacter agarilyticus]